LRETTTIIASTLDVSEAVHRILQQLRRVIAYDSASVWLYRGTTAYLVDGEGIPEIPEDDQHYLIGENDPDYPLWSKNLPYILLGDVQENYPQFREPPINYIRGWLAVPLKVRDELIGIISLDSRMVGGFSHADAQLALNFANQVSIAVENARLFSDLEGELEHRQKLIDELDSTNSELAREIDERKRIQDELQKLARTDSLTGLFNRGYFFEIAEKEFAKACRYNRPLSVAILDLDLFKDVNDTYGHLVGDRALIHVGNILRKMIRKPDIAARYGGEEFVVLLPETDHAAALDFAERLRELMENSPVKNNSDRIKLTISIGVASMYEDAIEETFDHLISQADQVLYQAKRNGRNQVVCYRNGSG
jgi:diguanylate cyclase (GGDEF)-like protein